MSKVDRASPDERQVNKASQTARSICLNGAVIREARLAVGWTQMQLAKKSGYSLRLIGKAENGHPIDLETAKTLAETLSIDGLTWSLQDLASGNVPAASVLALRQAIESRQLKVAKAFINHYDLGAPRARFAAIKRHFTPDVVFHCPVEGHQTPFAGSWHGAVGVQEFFSRFYGLFSRKLGSLTPEFMVSTDRVVAHFIDQVFFQGHEMPSYWVNIQFHFRDDLICRIVDEFDYYNAKRSFDELLARLASKS